MCSNATLCLKSVGAGQGKGRDLGKELCGSWNPFTNTATQNGSQ